MPNPASHQVNHGVGHAAEMYRNMGSLTQQVTLSIEECAGIIQTITYIG
jgi:hypothetical protein